MPPEVPELLFAQFGDGIEPGTQISSTISFFSLSTTSTATVDVEINDGSGHPMTIDLNGREFEGIVEDLLIAPGGIAVLETDGTGSLQVGSVRATSDVGISGVILFRGFGVAGVGSSKRAKQFRAPMIRGEALNSGIAIMNLETEQSIGVELRDELGSVVATTDLLLSPNAQIAQFLTEFDWDGSPDLSDFLGTVTVSAPADFAATVILVTEDEFATLPVTPLAGSEALKGSSESGSGELYFAQFGDGSDAGTSISSLILLFNVGSESADASIEINDDDGLPMTVDLNGLEVMGLLEDVNIPSNGVVALATEGVGALQTGSVAISSNREISGVILFDGAGVAGVGSSQRLRRFRAPMQSGQGLNTGIALMNLGDQQVIELNLRNGSGDLLATGSLPMGVKAHTAKFLTQFEWIPPVDFTSFSGTVTATGSADFAATVILVTQGQFATLPVTELVSGSAQASWRMTASPGGFRLEPFTSGVLTLGTLIFFGLCLSLVIRVTTLPPERSSE